MFDLDIIEMDWLNNSFKLSEEEIIKIYRSENITLSKYYEEIEKYKKNTHLALSAEERLLRIVFGDKEIIEREDKLREKYKYPTRKYLSKESQKKVIEGTLDIVFYSTREWYNFFNGKLSMERIYCICLEALMNSAKYMIHCEKPVFELYVIKSVERNIIKYIATHEHITYREVYGIIHNYNDNILERQNKEIELSLDYDNKEELEEPSKIFHKLKKELYEVDYIKNISSDEFMKDYISSLDNLDDIEKMIMQLSFDSAGNRGLTNAEIADYLGLEPKKVSNIRRKAIKTLRKDITLNTYTY